MNKVTDADTAVADIADGATLAVGGFDLCGIPTMLIRALDRSKTSALAVASNNCGTDKGAHQASNSSCRRAGSTLSPAATT
ncbi:CoA-transferase [Streptomyces sp. NPDC057620]|uniref:CoA-transferase n=1 Tax=Streptomyces sp. NPDC057620 TaxID=3346185 RepID=UPI00369F7396